MNKYKGMNLKTWLGVEHYVPVIPALGRLKQENYNRFENSLDYTVSTGQPGLYSTTLSQNLIKNKYKKYNQQANPFLKKISFYFYLFTYTCVCMRENVYPSAEEGVRSPGARVTGSFEPL